MDTLKQFMEQMESTEQMEALHVGPRHCNRNRFIFKTQGIVWYMETHSPHNWNKPMTTNYYSDYSFEDKGVADKAANKYNATVAEDPYSEDRYYLCFDQFEDIARFCYDRKNKTMKD